MTLSAMAVPSASMREASQDGTRPPCSGRSATPDRFITALSHGARGFEQSSLREERQSVDREADARVVAPDERIPQLDRIVVGYRVVLFLVIERRGSER